MGKGVSYSSHFQRVRNTFGKTFGEMIKELARQGHSFASSAEVLGIPMCDSFVRYAKRYAPDAEWRKHGTFIKNEEARRNRTPTKEEIDRLIEEGRKSNLRHVRTVAGVTGNLRELSAHFGISERAVRFRRAKGMTLEEALTTPKGEV